MISVIVEPSIVHYNTRINWGSIHFSVSLVDDGGFANYTFQKTYEGWSRFLAKIQMTWIIHEDFKMQVP